MRLYQHPRVFLVGIAHLFAHGNGLGYPRGKVSGAQNAHAVLAGTAEVCQRLPGR